MSEGYVARAYAPGDEGAIVGLLELVFGGWPHFDLPCSALDHWRWKFLDNPVTPPLISVVERAGEVVACTHKIPVRVWLDGKSVLGHVGGDLAVHPGHRGRDVSNIVLAHNRELARAHTISWFVSLTPLIQRQYARRRLPCPVVAFVRIRDIDAQLAAMPMPRARLMRLGFKAARALNGVRSALRGRPTAGELAVAAVGSFDEGVDAVCAEAARKCGLMTERSPEFLAWRYADPRAGGFSLRVVKEGERVIGYTVLKINRHRPEYPVGFVVDLLTLPGRLDAADALLADAAAYFDANGVNLVTACLVRGSEYQGALESHGFLDSRRQLPLYFGTTTRPDETGVIDFIAGLRSREVHFCYGDLDALPSSIAAVSRGPALR